MCNLSPTPFSVTVHDDLYHLEEYFNTRSRRLVMEEAMISKGLLIRITISVLLSALLSLYGLRKGSLSLSGGVAAFAVGFIHTMSSGCFCAALLTFFLTSSRLTKWRGQEKRRIEADYKEGGYAII